MYFIVNCFKHHAQQLGADYVNLNFLFESWETALHERGVQGNSPDQRCPQQNLEFHEGQSSKLLIFVNFQVIIINSWADDFKFPLSHQSHFIVDDVWASDRVENSALPDQVSSMDSVDDELHHLHDYLVDDFLSPTSPSVNVSPHNGLFSSNNISLSKMSEPQAQDENSVLMVSRDEALIMDSLMVSHPKFPTQAVQE